MSSRSRVDRASRNYLETFAFFAAAVLVVVVGQRTNAQTALGAQLYVWARVIYLPVYAIGIPYLRTLVEGGEALGEQNRKPTHNQSHTYHVGRKQHAFNKVM